MLTYLCNKQEEEKSALTTNCLIRDKLTAQVRRCVLTVTFHTDNDDEDKKKNERTNERNSEYLISF